MGRCRVTPERIELSCRAAVAGMLAQVADITGLQCDAKVQCVCKQYVKGQRYLEFSWSIDDLEPITVTLRADAVVTKHRLKPPRSWILSLAQAQLPRLWQRRPPRWLKQGEKVVCVATAKEAEVPDVRWVTDEGDRIRPVLPLARIDGNTYVCYSFESGRLNLRDDLVEYKLDDAHEPAAKKQRGESLKEYALDNKQKFDTVAAVATFKAEETRARNKKREMDMIMAQSSMEMNPFLSQKNRKVIVMLSSRGSSRAHVRTLISLLKA